MLFNHISFFYFLAVCLPVYWLLRNYKRQNPFLLAASWYFYMAWDQRFLVLILVSTVIDYLASLGMDGKTVSRKMRLGLFASLALALPLLLKVSLPLPGGFQTLNTEYDFGLLYGGYLAGLAGFWLVLHGIERLDVDRKRKALLLFSICTNLGILGFFKYFNFFIDSFSLLLVQAGLQPHLSTLSIILPVGISFYTFQTMGHTIDVYRRKTTSCESFVDFATYVAYFPQLLAGPIERSKDLISQLQQPRSVDLEDIGNGVRLIVWGLFLKIWVADSVAMVSNYIFALGGDKGHYTGSGYAAMVGAFAFAFQIYGDFAGYSNIARGVSRLFGIHLSRNFRMPYFARNPSDFWQRWHITLSSWLRDYLYIPLGGNRRGTAMTVRNLMVTMLLGGLWHGAAMTFVVWGALHGVFLGVYHALEKQFARMGNRIPVILLSVVLTFIVVDALWIFFRAPTLVQALDMFGAMFTNFGAGTETRSITYMLRFVMIHAFPLLLVQLINRHKDDEVNFDSWPLWARGLLYYILILFINAASNQSVEFIYFQF